MYLNESMCYELGWGERKREGTIREADNGDGNCFLLIFLRLGMKRYFRFV